MIRIAIFAAFAGMLALAPTDRARAAYPGTDLSKGVDKPAGAGPVRSKSRIRS
jgi:hypothetical protein